MSYRVAERPAPEAGAGMAEALAALAAGRPLMLVHEDQGRSYFVAAADRAAEDFVVHAQAHGRGVLKVAMTPERLEHLGIPPLAGTDAYGPVDVHGAERPGAPADRIATLRALVDPGLTRDDLMVPGHVFPTAAGECDSIDEACLARVTIEAARLAGCAPAAAFCEAADEHGHPADRSTAARLAGRLGLEVVTLRELMIHRESVEPSVSREVQTTIPTPAGLLSAVGYVGTRGGEEYVAFSAGAQHDVVRVHAHRRCQVSDVFGGVACRCGERLHAALQDIQAAGDGVVVYYGEQSEGFCAGVDDQEEATWTFTAELAAVLRDLGVQRVALSSNGPLAVGDLDALGVEVVGVP